MEKPAVEPRPQPAVSAQSTYKDPEQLDLADTYNFEHTWTQRLRVSRRSSQFLVKKFIILLSLSRKKCQESFKTKGKNTVQL